MNCLGDRYSVTTTLLSSTTLTVSIIHFTISDLCQICSIGQDPIQLQVYAEASVNETTTEPYFAGHGKKAVTVNLIVQIQS